jgi:tight adherence protein B
LRRVGLILVLLTAALAFAPAAGATERGLTLTESGNASFPNRAYLLSLPPGKLARPQQVKVRENGHVVEQPQVVSASVASARGFGVVLVIDTSRSMKGRPISDAMAAARAFARRRQSNQQLGVVTFNGTSNVALPLTQDDGAISRALSVQPSLGRNTHIFDGVDVAVRMLAAARLKPTSVVVLSDGSDTGSHLASAAVTKEARKSGIRVFSVGLRSGAFDPGSLQGLARGTGGIYNEASGPGDLTRIYDELGTRLANEYLITYRSLAGPHDRVHVSVQVAGVPGLATAEYTTPALRIQGPAAYSGPSFWDSAAAQLLVSALCALLLVATLYFIFGQPGRRGLRRRVAQFVSPEPVAGVVVDGNGPMLAAPAGFLAGFGRTFSDMEWWPRFEEELDVARIDVEPERLAGATAAGTILLLLLVMLATGNFLIASLAGLIPIGVRRFIQFKAARQRKQFAEQLADNLMVISSALRAGHSLVGAMAVAVHDAPQPTKREFERVVEDEKLGVPLGDGLSVVARRMKNRDLEQVMLVASLQRETGGNTAEVLDRVADTVRERADIRRMVSTLTAQGRISRWIVTALPVVLAVAITSINPTYLHPLLHTPIGHVMIVMAVLFLIAGSMVIKKIVTIEV